MFKKRWWFLLLAGILMFSACNQKEKPTETAVKNALDYSWLEITQRGKMIVYITEQEPALKDFSKELVLAIGDRLGISVELMDLPRKEAVQKIKNKQADLAFAEVGNEIGCSETILTIQDKNYAFLYRKDDLEFASLIEQNLQGLANEDILAQFSNQYFHQDYSSIKSQIDTGIPTEEEAEEYDKRLKEMRESSGLRQ